MAEEETVPNIDWGYTGDGTIETGSFTTLPRREGVLRFSLKRKEGRELDFIISYAAVIGLEKACAETRKNLGF